LSNLIPPLEKNNKTFELDKIIEEKLKLSDQIDQESGSRDSQSIFSKMHNQPKSDHDTYKLFTARLVESNPVKFESTS
jgi:hypothetical protein